MNWLLPMKSLYFHFMFLLAFVLMLGLGFGGCLSLGNVYLAVVMADGCVLWSACTCNSKVSTFPRRMQMKWIQNTQSDFSYGQWFNLRTLRVLCLPREPFPWCSDENPCPQTRSKKLIIEWNGIFHLMVFRRELCISLYKFDLSYSSRSS